MRPDLMHFSPEALAHASNAGVVKRAVRELEGGYRPQWELDDAATLIARFSDGIVTTWPQGKPISQISCTCGAATVCRHRIIAALAFRQDAVDAATTDTPDAFAPDAVSPGQVSDAALASLIPTSLLQIAERELAQGLSVEVRRKAAGEPCDTARLPASSVRFWAGAAIEAARCDCIRGSACEHVAIAVWAYRKADAELPGVAATQVWLGKQAERATLDRAPYLELVDALLRHGVAQGPMPTVQALSTAFAAARTTGAIWIEHLLADVERWSAAYARRSALYLATDGADLIAELGLRTSAGSAPGNAMGIGLPGETELDRLRLMCIGARTGRDGELRRTRMVLADVDTGTRLVLVKEWSVPEDQFANEAAIRASERLAPGVRLEQLAQGQLLAQQAKRMADGTLKLAKSRSSQNSVLPQAADWDSLSTPLRFSRVDHLVSHKRENPTAQLLPRHAAGQFIVFSPCRFDRIFYDPNEQSLTAMFSDEDDNAVVVQRSHENHLRNALDAFAGACAGKFGPLRHIAGVLNWVKGIPVIEPWAIACDSVVVLDFAPACGMLEKVAIGHFPVDTGDNISQALVHAREVISILLHHGLVRMPRSWTHDTTEVARQLRALSLHALAQRLEKFAGEAVAAQARPDSVQLGALLMELMALLQLHMDAQVSCRLEAAARP